MYFCKLFGSLCLCTSILDFYFGVMMEMILNFCDTHFFYDENDENMMFLRNLLTTINVTNFTTTTDTHSFYTLHTVIYTPTQKLHATLTLCTSNRVCEKITTFYPYDFEMATPRYTCNGRLNDINSLVHFAFVLKFWIFILV